MPEPTREGSRSCIACDAGPPFPVVYRHPDGTLVRCPGCGLVFQDPPPGPALLADAYYGDEEFARRLDGEWRPAALERARGLMRRLGLPAGGRVLDVGCAAGAFLEVAAAAGWEATGVELGAPLVRAARRRGLDVREGPLTAAGLAGERFDLITFWDVLEHLPDPREELRLARELLAPGGVVAASFPNVEGWYPRTTLRLLASRTGVWEHPELPLHLYELAPDSARRLFDRCGFAVRRLETMPIPFSHFRATTLRADRVGRRNRLAAELLRLAVYPAARLANRQNAIFLTSTLPAP
jgi:SAM-dependent methyltransferase